MKAVIVEDEELAARNLTSVLDETGTVQVIATLESIVETIEWFKQPENIKTYKFNQYNI